MNEEDSLTRGGPFVAAVSVSLDVCVRQLNVDFKTANKFFGSIVVPPFVPCNQNITVINLSCVMCIAMCLWTTHV